MTELLDVPDRLPSARGQCRHPECTDPPTRLLPGKRRTFYCDRHGPSKLTDWDRLVPLGLAEPGTPGEPSDPTTPTIRRSVAGLPAQIAGAVDALVTALLDYAGAPAECPECPKLREELAQVRAANAALEALATEAMEYVPSERPPVISLAEEMAPIVLPPPRSNGVAAAGRPRAPRPPKAPPAPVPPANPNELPVDPLTLADPTDEEFQTLEIDAILNKLPRGRNTPPLFLHARLADEWKMLNLADRRRAFHAFKRMAGGLKHVAMYPVKERGRVAGVYHSYMLKAGQRLRILLTWEEGVGFVIERFVDRANRQYYSTE